MDFNGRMVHFDFAMSYWWDSKKDVAKVDQLECHHHEFLLQKSKLVVLPVEDIDFKVGLLIREDKRIFIIDNNKTYF
jgi:hypothetical protein